MQPVSSLVSPNAAAAAAAPAASVPRYLEQVYWWAYVHPRAVHVFEREWLVNAILFGHYARLRDAALESLSSGAGVLQGRVLQVACVYGNLTPRLLSRLAPDARLEVVDILPIQLQNLRAKLAPERPLDARVHLLHSDAAALPMADASVDQALLFFLLHEQPEAVRRATLAEVMRVVRPGGRIVIVDYHRPVRWHPLRPLMRMIFRRLEPYAMDLWRSSVEAHLPEGLRPQAAVQRTWFGGLYQQLVWTR